VHYRKAGNGPPVLLLHQSPVSSAEYIHLMAQWGEDFTLIAPDTPGFGLSDALPGSDPHIEPYAVAVAQFLDAIGVQKCGVYGTHTGAMIAAEFARAFPQRCEVCVLNGYVVATDAEKADVMAHYFVPLHPVQDGSHMVWAWVRMRDQMMFYPWYRKTAQTRMTFDIPGPEFLQPFTMDYFRSANAGIRAYKAAFTYDAITGLKGMTAPCYAMAFQQDVLHEHLGRIPKDNPACIKIEAHATPATLETRARQIFKQMCKAPAPGPCATATIESRPWRRMAETKSGQLYLHHGHMGSGRPLVLLHDAGKSSRQWDLVVQMLHGRKPTLALDLPGHGDSEASSVYSVSGMAAAMRGALSDIGAEEIDLLAIGASCALAAELAQDATVKSLTLIDPWSISPERAAKLAPDLTPNWYGGHLVQAWAVARDSELYWPWFEPTHANALKVRPELEPWAVHHKAVDLLKAAAAHGAYARSAAETDLKAALSKVKCEITVAALAHGPHEAAAKQLSQQVMSLSDDPSRYAAALAAMFRAG
jgi:pimeloyl-ACP methyl ester carboxylesterase